MLRTFVWPALAFLSGLGALKAAIPLKSLALMAVGLALSSFGLLRLMLRDLEVRTRPAFKPMAVVQRPPGQR